MSARDANDFLLLRSAIVFIEEDDDKQVISSDYTICNSLLDSNGCIKFLPKLDDQLDHVEIFEHDLTIANLSACLTILTPDLNIKTFQRDAIYHVKAGSIAEMCVMRRINRSQRHSVYQCSQCREISVIKPSKSPSTELKTNPLLFAQAHQVQVAVQSLLRESEHNNHSPLSLLFITDCHTDFDNKTNKLPMEVIESLLAAIDSFDHHSKVVSVTLPSLASSLDTAAPGLISSSDNNAERRSDILIARALRLLCLLCSGSRRCPAAAEVSVLVVGPCDNHPLLPLQMICDSFKEQEVPSILIISWTTGGSSNSCTQKIKDRATMNTVPSLSISLATNNNDNNNNKNNNIISSNNASAVSATRSELPLSPAMSSAWELLKAEIERRLLWRRCLPPLLLSRLGLGLNNPSGISGGSQSESQVMGGWIVCGPANSGKTSFTLTIVQQSSYLPSLLNSTSIKAFSVLQPSLAMVISGSIGGSESNLLHHFHQAISKAPAVLILSEAMAMLNLSGTQSNSNSNNSMVAALVQGLTLFSSWNQQQLTTTTAKTKQEDKANLKLVFCVLLWRGVDSLAIPSALIRPDRLWPVVALTSLRSSAAFNPFVDETSSVVQAGVRGSNSCKRDARMKRQAESSAKSDICS